MTEAPDDRDDLTFDERTFLALIPRLRSYARHLCRDPVEAEDLTQAALARGWRRRDTFVPGTNMRAWMLTILRNQFYSDRRRAWRLTHFDPKLAEETLLEPGDATASLDLDDVRRGLLDLSEDHRRALSLITVAGLSYGEAAKLCGCALGTLKSRVNRARASLVQIMDEGDLSAAAGRAEKALTTLAAMSEFDRRPSSSTPAAA